MRRVSCVSYSNDDPALHTFLTDLDSGSSKFSLCPCGRRHFLGDATTTTPFLPIPPSHAAQTNSSEVLNKLRPPKPDWYFELYGWFRSSGMERYEKEIAGYKKKLFNQVGNAEKVLEIGIGAGPNIKYYNTLPNVSILGVDPNPKMESYARKSAIQAGLKSEDFKFIHAVAECIPLEDASVDAVVTSLVMCSVTDVTQTLNEIKRILKPGGRYLFVEHVAAEDGSFLRMVQNVLDPVQQVVADGCHLTRPTGESIIKAGFNGGVDINKASLTSFYHLSPHIYGVAFCPCGRRHFIGAMSSMPFLPISPSHASTSTDDLKRLRPPKPDWYEEFFAWSMNTEMESYEKEISDYKMKLFDNLVGKAEKVLEIGIGTGPNFKYYTAIPNLSVIGVDPNAKMENYARKSAAEAGLKSEDFTFIHALGESIPLEDASVDAVVGTLVLCSVTDVTGTLNEIKRILRPGGIYIFIEHVAAEDGTFLRLVQNVLDPLQQVVADGCHLTRRTGESILEARFNGGADEVSETFHPQRPDWYKELFAWFLSTGMRSYEAEIADYKRKLFEKLAGKAETVLEIGVGTGPNLKYFAGNENVCVFGMDPNHKMEKYASESAREAGMKPENFRFIQGVGEAIPLDDESMDAVVATLVLCSVSDVTQTLNEIKRVLKPGGIFLFIEHVAAKDGSIFRHVQNVLDPVQQVVADGCHLTRNTDLYISAAGFDGGTEINNTAIYSFPWIIRPHVYGAAYK
ncbi:unnamed protein product [Arabidopsis arenosa]|uniref:Methyltransferase type 11 domain-containing protein n=2 Tax=Arabidopsis arenosa TaxID=38785 RepID=A0A8S1ZP34_ARAAE|nr:unnamed protein product [Arabidopsis arenosa]